MPGRGGGRRAALDRGAGSGSPGPLLGGEALGGHRSGPELAEIERQRPHRAERPDDRERRDRLARPAGEVVLAERSPPRQQDPLGGQRRQLVPRPQAEECHPEAGEDAAALDATGVADVGRRLLHVGCLGVVAREAQRPVRLDARRQVGGSRVVRRPRAVGALLRPDPVRRRGRDVVGANAQELAEEQVLGLDGDVGLEQALPPSVRRLEREQVVPSPVAGIPDDVDVHQNSRSTTNRARSASSSCSIAASARSRWLRASASVRSRAPVDSIRPRAWSTSMSSVSSVS